MRTRRTAVLAWLIDVVAVAVFVLIGRHSHGEDGAGFALTFLPFFAALQVGWLLRSGRHPIAIVASGVTLWLTTVILGLLLRVATGDDAPPPFVIVTTLVLGAFLVGWRAIAALIRRLLRPRALQN